FTATQYALFSSLYAIPGRLIASQSGRIVETAARRPRTGRALSPPNTPVPHPAARKLRRRGGTIGRQPGSAWHGIRRVLRLLSLDRHLCDGAGRHGVAASDIPDLSPGSSG